MLPTKTRSHPLSPDEQGRLRSLASYSVVGTEPERDFDELARLAADLLDCPVGLVTFVDAEHVWLKSRGGLELCQADRGASICSHAILEDDALVVPDLRADERFASHPMVTGEPFFRFYAGVPLVSPGGHKIGTLCVLDRRPRRELSDKEHRLLAHLASIVMDRLEVRRLRFAETVASRLAEASADAMVCADGEGTITAWNRCAEVLFGYSPAEAVGRPLALLFPDRHRIAYAGAFRRLIQGRSAVRDGKTVEVIGRHREGWEIPVELSIALSRAGGQLAVVAVARDASERRSREAALDKARREADQAAAEARRLHAHLQMAIDELPEGIAFFDAERRYTMWNKRYEEMYSLTADVLVPGLPFEAFLRACLARGQLPDAVGQEEAWIARRLELNDRPRSSDVRRLPGDRWLRVEERRMPDGGRIGIRIDITDLKRREESFRLLFEGNPVPMWLYDTETLNFLAVNDAALEHYGYDRERFLSLSALEIRPVEERAVAADVMRAVTSSYRSDRVWRHLRADGSEIQVVTFARPLTYDRRKAVLLASIDVTERLRAEARVTHMALHDVLTDLPNRALFRERLIEALDDRGPGDAAGVALLLVDLDGFKPVNDTFGHDVGDALLRDVAGRLGTCVREKDTVARLGGDEFAILLPGVSRPETAGAVANRVIEALGAPFAIGEHQITVGASVGIAMAPPNDEAGPELLLKNADVALYQAKSDGRGTYRFFEPAMDLRLQLRHALEFDLRQALRREELELHYQPLVDTEAGSITGFEALLRWRHPERGMLPPGDFIPLAEETGLIVPIGEWVLRRACAEAVTWPEGVKVAVNLSPVQIKAGDLVATVKSALESSGLAPKRLELEITESMLLQNNEGTLSALNQLRALGARISLDDFGTGYSSLSYLRMFPFDRIKVDRSFVRNLVENENCLAIVRAVAVLGAGLGMATTAEGVETAEQLDKLRHEGVTEVQGYYLGRPGPASAIPAFLRDFGRSAGVAA